MSEKIIAIPTHVKPSVDKDGRRRPGHISTRHRAVPVSGEAAAGENATALDSFIAKHGGVEHLRESLEAMTADQRAKLLDAMAHVDGTDAAAVMKKLGIYEPEASEDAAAIAEATAQFRARMMQAKDENVLTFEEYDAVLTTLEEDGLEYAVKQLQTLREPVAAQAPEAHFDDVARANSAALSAAAEGAAGARAALQAQADGIYQQHVDAQNAANRADFEIEKRGIRKWKIPEQMRTDAEQLRADAAKYLDTWGTFCREHGIDSGLS